MDGNDTKFSNWMSMIQCARHKEEQNMTVFQYNGNLYYRAFRDILPYTELLVWYDDRYSDSMDIERISMAGSDTLSSRISGNSTSSCLLYYLVNVVGIILTIYLHM